MPFSRDHRLAVLDAGRRGGWTHEPGVFDGGNIVVDTFSMRVGVVRVVWLRTPWKDSRFAGAVFSERATQKDHNVWSLRKKRGLIPLLDDGTLS